MRRAALLLAAVLCMGAASDPSERLADPAAEARARAVMAEVRCLVCQNESIDDSEAPLAADLRRFVRERVARGEDGAAIKRELVGRYGDFVLLRPALDLGNAVLWGTPFLIAAAGAAALLLRRGRRTAGEPLTADEERRLALLTAAEGGEASASRAAGD